MRVKKRNSTLEELDLNKIHAVLEWACNGNNDEKLSPIKGVSVSQIEMASNLHLHDKIKTSAIHEILIKAAANLISEQTPNYDQVAARLVWFAVRKEAFGSHNPPHLRDVIDANIRAGFYTPELREWYSDDDLDVLNGMIDHRRDDLFRYAGAEQMRTKYLVQNRKTKKLYESFQFTYMMVAATLFARYPRDVRMGYVKKFYDAISQHYISLPTPIMSGVRTREKQFSSCVVMKAGDSRESINKTASSILDYVSRKAGIGFDAGRLRAIGQPIRTGDAISTGMVPFLKYFNAALKSVSQGGIRSASATAFWWGLHLEFDSLIELKNNKGTEETRIRTLDYGVAINGLMYQRLVDGGNITLFSPEEVPDLYEAFYSPNQELFRLLYEKYEADPKKTKKTIPAIDYFTKLLSERFETGRIYIFHADIVNTHTPFKAPIYSSNLCLEIALPTANLSEEDEMISLCILGAINWGKFSSKMTEADEAILAQSCELIVRALNALIDYQEYPIESARKSTMMYRPLGVGLIGFAHWLARSKLKWGHDNTIAEVERMMEKQAFYLTRASIDLAEETGAISGANKYHDGIFPIDTSTVAPLNLQMDWATLRERAKQHGVKNAVLMALMPSECQSKDNAMLLADGTVKTLGEILIESGVDVEKAERECMIGSRFHMRRVDLPNGNYTHEAYYNGPQTVYEVRTATGGYKFTANHLLMVNGSWVRVDALQEGALLSSNDGVTEVLSIREVGIEHTWDISTKDETYLLSNGVLSHNTSSVLSNETNGIEPPRSLITVKANKSMVTSQVVPEFGKLAHYYEVLWDVETKDYLRTIASLQKFVDQSISTNTTYDPRKGEITMSKLLGDLIYSYKQGFKTLYYCQVNDQSGGEEEDGCASGACKI